MCVCMIYNVGVFFYFPAMKLLENSCFEALGSQLCVETGDARILGRYKVCYLDSGFTQLLKVTCHIENSFVHFV